MEFDLAVVEKIFRHPPWRANQRRGLKLFCLTIFVPGDAAKDPWTARESPMVISSPATNYGAAALSFAAMVPLAGWGATAAKFGLKYGDEALAGKRHAECHLRVLAS